MEGARKDLALLVDFLIVDLLFFCAILMRVSVA